MTPPRLAQPSARNYYYMYSCVPTAVFAVFVMCLVGVFIIAFGHRCATQTRTPLFTVLTLRDRPPRRPADRYTRLRRTLRPRRA